MVTPNFDLNGFGSDRAPGFVKGGRLNSRGLLAMKLGAQYPILFKHLHKACDEYQKTVWELIAQGTPEAHRKLEHFQDSTRCACEGRLPPDPERRKRFRRADRLLALIMDRLDLE